jgi:hypothetical protein
MEREDRQPDGTVRTVRTGISRVDVQMLLHSLFSKYGLPDYPITLLVENASAAISPELELCLTTLFEGRITIKRTGLINSKTVTNGFVERGGRPWEKGWIESTFNQLWNILGGMKGYKGSNQRMNAPASLDDALRYTKLLLGQGERALNLPTEQIQKLKLPFMSPAEAEAAFAWAIEVNETRDNHQYIGFPRVTEFLLNEADAPVPLEQLATLSPELQLAVRPVERMQTVIERWSAAIATVKIAPIPSAVLSLLLLTPKRVQYRNHAITFTIGGAGYTYLDRSGKVLAGRGEGEEFLAYFDANASDILQLCDLKGRYLGELERLGGLRGAVDIRDEAALKAAAELQAIVVNRTVAEVTERHAGQRAQAEADRAHNAEVVREYKAATEGLTTAQRIGAAATENREEQARAVRRARPEKSRHGLADLTATPASESAPAAPSLSDLLG